ncbi:hypothetical protein K450DRAFT_258396 [Umbelopsis ramanniana AG]|uniref:RING-type E3 ubiquitin transferase n=1 Tax=Umbelopsis ramanniana AG TaxID=1314678 RepID=A0AAD5E1Y4_UMBRA|nr:uncharacterized protein K450DRAFT_258396 [Umbelopsis ramanniana AG]KAI8576088.1 hypothetical protein K450DRAFT_258396 [Umbelopsis ramanniana AG]
MDEYENPHLMSTTESGTTSISTIIDISRESNASSEPLIQAATDPPHISRPDRELDADFQSTSNLKVKRKREPSVQEPDSQDDLVCQCPICFEKWGNTGSHRLISMKCGHLFGQSCIEKWIARARKDTKAKCPQCNANISKRDIRPIWAKQIISVDSCKIEQMKTDFEALRQRHQEQEIELSKLRLAYQMCRTELMRKDAEIKRFQLLVGNNTAAVDIGVRATASLIHGLEFDKKLKFHETANICRVMAFNPGYNMIVASKSTPAGVHGVQKISLVDNLNLETVVNHSRAIRDIQCSPSGLCLTTALDSTAKITSLKDNCVVQSYNLTAPGWCCSWDEVDENRLYCGLIDDSVMVFDVRNTREHIYHLKNHELTKKKPIHSIVHMGGPKNSILCANLDCLYQWDLSGDAPVCSVIEVDSQGYHPYSVSYDKASATILASFRSQTSTKHIHGSLAENILEVQNVFHNPQKQTALARTWHFSKPRVAQSNDSATEYVICAGDEVEKSLCLWDDVSTRRCIDIGSNVMDVKTSVINNEVYLATLTGNEMHLYRS